MKNATVILITILVLGVGIFISCTNPFAPSLSENAAGEAILGDQSTVEGLFKNFRYSYIFKDTLIYGKLLANDFTFIYYDTESGTGTPPKSWGREEDMLTTYRLFNAAQNLELVWNDVIIAEGDSLEKSITRGFTLTVTFNPNDQINVFGWADFRLERGAGADPWLITEWKDKLNY